MNSSEQELKARVDRKLKPIMHVVWSGFLSLAIWIVLIVGVVTEIISGEMLVSLGLLSILLPGIMGIRLAQIMIKINLVEEEEKRMAELGLLEKRKNKASERVGLSDEGELIDYNQYFEEEAQARHSAS